MYIYTNRHINILNWTAQKHRSESVHARKVLLYLYANINNIVILLSQSDWCSESGSIQYVQILIYKVN